MINNNTEVIVTLKIKDILADPYMSPTKLFDTGSDKGLVEQLQFLAEYGLTRGYVLTCAYHNTVVYTHKSAFKLGE